MKWIEVITEAQYLTVVQEIAARQEVVDMWWSLSAGEQSRVAVKLLVRPAQAQMVVDELYGVLGSNGRIVILNAEAVLPLEEDDEKKIKKSSKLATREELYNGIEQGAQLDGNFILLTVLSTVVASIGLVTDNVAVVIGAMVIAPLLGPNLAFALGSALGDGVLAGKALRVSLAGLTVAGVLSFLIGRVWPLAIQSQEIMSRTDVGLDSIALALASGAAAALSVTTGLSSVLVGVMVAVALLPPVASAGMLAGGGHTDLALNASLLLAVNIVCVNLSANIVFLSKGVRPRTWFAREKARQSMTMYILFWIVSLSLLAWLIFSRGKYVFQS